MKGKIFKILEKGFIEELFNERLRVYFPYMGKQKIKEIIIKRISPEWAKESCLAKYQIILENIPHDFELRLEIGDELETLGFKDQALAVFETVAEHDTKSGNPLRAIAATKRISALKGDPRTAIKTIARMY